MKMSKAIENNSLELQDKSWEGIWKYSEEIQFFLSKKFEKQKQCTIQDTKSNLSLFKNEIRNQKSYEQSNESNELYDTLEWYNSFLKIFLKVQKREETNEENFQKKSVWETDIENSQYLEQQWIFEFLENKNKPQAIFKLKQSIKIQEQQIPNTLTLADTYQTMAFIQALDESYDLWWNKELALAYLKKATSIVSEKLQNKKIDVVEDTLAYSLLYFFITSLFISLHRFDEALTFLNAIEQYTNVSEDIVWHSQNRENFEEFRNFIRNEKWNIYRRQHQFDKALAMYDTVTGEKREEAQALKTLTQAKRIVVYKWTLQPDQVLDFQKALRILETESQNKESLFWYANRFENVATFHNMVSQMLKSYKRNDLLSSLDMKMFNSLDKRLATVESQLRIFFQQELPKLKYEIYTRLSEKRIRTLENQVRNIVTQIQNKPLFGKITLDTDEADHLREIFQNQNLREYYTTSQSIMNALYTSSQALSTGKLAESIPKTFENTLTIVGYLPYIGKAIRLWKIAGIDGSQVDNLLSLSSLVDAKILVNNFESPQLMSAISEKISYKLTKIRKNQIRSFPQQELGLKETLKQYINSYSEIVSAKESIKNGVVEYLSEVSNTRSEIEAVSDMTTIAEFFSKKLDNDFYWEEKKWFWVSKWVIPYKWQWEVSREDFLANQALVYLCWKSIDHFFSKEQVQAIKSAKENESFLREFMKNTLYVYSNDDEITNIYLTQFKKWLEQNVFFNDV